MQAREELDRLAGKIARGEMQPDEPLFVLRAQDKLAAYVVRLWAQAAAASGTPDDKVREALALADSMERWPHRRIPGRPETMSRQLLAPLAPLSLDVACPVCDKTFAFRPHKNASSQWDPLAITNCPTCGSRLTLEIIRTMCEENLSAAVVTQVMKAL